MLFTTNRKTVISLDLDRSSCNQKCDYCYVNNTEKAYPAYLPKIKKNNFLAEHLPDEFAKQLNSEYEKLTKSKSKLYSDLDKLPVRIYGSGDYQKSHYKWLKQLNFQYFIISKNLTSDISEVYRLLAIPNLTKIVLSYDKDNIHRINENIILLVCGMSYKTLKGRIAFSFTGTAKEFKALPAMTKETINIFFNIGRKKADLTASKSIPASCPADAGHIPTSRACTKCNKCHGGR